jgi:hypothetical protein
MHMSHQLDQIVPAYGNSWYIVKDITAVCECRVFHSLQVPGNSYAGGAAVPAPQSALQQPPTAAGLAGGAATVPFWRRLFARPSSAASVTTGAQLCNLLGPVREAWTLSMSYTSSPKSSNPMTPYTSHDSLLMLAPADTC